MIKTYKVMLLPNNKQRTKLFECAGVARLAYNFALAVVSTGQKFTNINKSNKVKKLEKRLKRLQRKLSKNMN